MGEFSQLTMELWPLIDVQNCILLKIFWANGWILLKKKVLSHTLIRSWRLDNNISFSLILNRVSVLDGFLCIENILWQGMMQRFI